MELLFTPFDLLFRQAVGGLDVLLPARTLEDTPILVITHFQPWVEVADEALLTEIPRGIRVERVLTGHRVYYEALRDWQKAVDVLGSARERYARMSLAKRFLMEHGLTLFSVWRADAEPIPVRARVTAYRASRIIQDDPLTFIPHALAVQPVVRQRVRGSILTDTALSWEEWGEQVGSEADVLKHIERSIMDADVILGLQWDVLLPHLASRAERLNISFKPGVDFSSPIRREVGWGVRGTVLVDARRISWLDEARFRLLEDAYADVHIHTALEKSIPFSYQPLLRMLIRDLPVMIKLTQVTRETLGWTVHASAGELFIAYSGEQTYRERGKEVARRFAYTPHALATPTARVRFPTLFADTVLRWNAAADTLQCSCCQPDDGGGVWHCTRRESRLLRSVQRLRDRYAAVHAIVQADPRLQESMKAAELEAYRVLLLGVEDAYLLPGSPFYAPLSVRFIREQLARLIRRVQPLIVAFENDTFYLARQEDVLRLVQEVEAFTRRRMPYVLETFDRALLVRKQGVSLAFEREGRLRMEGFASRLEGLSGFGSLVRDVIVKRIVEGSSRQHILQVIREYAARLPGMPWTQLVMSLDTTSMPRRVWREKPLREALRKARESLLFYVKLTDEVLVLDELARLSAEERERLRARLDVEYYVEMQLLRPVMPFLRVLDIPLEEAEEAAVRGIMQSGYYMTPEEDVFSFFPRGKDTEDETR